MSRFLQRICDAPCTDKKKVSWQRPTLPGGCPPSTIGAGRLNFRVRDVSGCTPAAPVTKRPFYHLSLHLTFEYLFPRKVPSSPHHTVSPRPLVRLSSTHCCASTCRLSAGSLPAALLPFQDGGPYLEASFPLRCFQRLSLPDVATQLCRWHDNWHTRGLSTPVLSY